MEDFDTLSFIAAVERQPLIWDRSRELYKCRTSTAKAWDTLAKELHPNIDEVDAKQKVMYINMLTRKWKNLRDTWRKAQKRMFQAAEDETEEPSRAYMYQEQMKFLEQVEYPLMSKPVPSSKLDVKTENSATPTTSTQSSVSGDIGSGSSSQTVSGNGSNPKKRIRILSFPDTTTSSGVGSTAEKICKFVTNVSEASEVKDQVESRHASFFRSLIPSLKQLEEEQILEFQVGVLNLLRTVRKRKGNSASSSSSITDFLEPAE